MSPILSNIYLDRLDKFVEQVLLPQYNRGAQRTKNPAYFKLVQDAWYRDRTGRHDEARAMRRQARTLPARDPHDPDFRRLHYVRYADDFLLGFTGPRSEAEEIKSRLREFLRDTLKLELAEAKTLITHARTQAARFLGYEVVALHDDTKRAANGARSINGHIGLKVPVEVVKAKCRPYLRHGKAKARPERRHDSDFSIVAQYQAEYRGVVRYYQLAYNVHRFARLKWVIEQSLTMTLAGKHKTSVRKVYEQYHATLSRPEGSYEGLRVVVERTDGKPPLVAEWGGILLRRQRTASTVLDDQPARIWNVGTELLQRFLADTCELCGSRDGVQVHHVRALKDLQPHRKRKQRKGPQPEWAKVMVARRRKTLVACRTCHEAIHAGRSRGMNTDKRHRRAG